PVMAKVRIGHTAEALILEALGVDMIDESEVLTPADPFFHIDKRKFNVPFVCGARNLGEAVRRIWEGAAMIRTKGEAGTGNIIEAVRHVRLVNQNIKMIQKMRDEELFSVAKKFAEPYLRLNREIKELSTAPENLLEEEVYENYSFGEIISGIYEILIEIKKLGRLPVVNFAAGGVATPADAALMMQMGMDGVFVGSGIFKSENPEKMARAIVEAVNNYDKPDVLAEISKGLGEPMRGIDVKEIEEGEKLQVRGW
ncbi:MAG: pyridoxal 5'-phosphate synthase lyase subunit PdxS, partial [Archaeoglobi archaeon]|nr:pyridoxal 5'-phosphate synthase lyase subunit PdxS [Candidatus Mnemosynella bozhongmuii]